MLPTLEIKGYKREQKAEAAMQCCFSALIAELASKVVADTRDNSKPAVRLRVEAWTLLEDAGLVRKCLGSELSRKTTRYRARPRLAALRKEWTPELIQELKKPSDGPLLGLAVFKRKMDDDGPTEVPFDRVIAHYTQKDKRGRPDPQAYSTGIAMTRVVEELINQINNVNLDHAWKTKKASGVVFHPSVELVQMHIGELWRGVRYYTRGQIGGQNLKKKERARLTIDGKPTVELDISGSIPRLAYHLRGLDAPEGDVYMPQRIVPEVWKFCDDEDRATVRAFIKTATQICFNVGRRSSAVGAIRKERRKYPAGWPVADLPSAPRLVKRIAKVHRAISDDLFADRGMRLVTVEGQIMFQVLRQFVLHARKPALAIHDALRVKQQHAKLAYQIMREVYYKRTGHFPLINVEKS